MGRRGNGRSRRRGRRRAPRRTTAAAAGPGRKRPALGAGISEPEYAESVGSTLEDAIQKALDVLDAREDEVDVEILQEGKRGFLGFGVKQPFRVRVSWREDSTEEILVGEEREPSGPAAREGAAPRPRVAPEPVGDGVPLSASQVSEAESLAAELLGLMGLESEVRATEEPEGEIRIDMAGGEDEALLIGRRGETRAALQHILHRILSRRAGRSIPVLVDVAGYWERRARKLDREARDLAERAIREGAGVLTDDLSPQERRIIHRALLEDDRVATESIGKGLFKRVSIRPR